jgi:hypothetical protein
LLDDLNRLGFAYRWSTRFLCLDKAEAEKELGRLRRQWFAKRKNVLALLRETIFQQESPLVDTDASNKAADADAALQELGSDQVAFGYVTATVTVLDADANAADEKLRMVERVIQGPGVRHHPRDAERRGGLAVVGAGQCLRQCAPAHRLDAESRAPDAGIGGVGRAGEERPPRRTAADRDAHRGRDAVPAGDAHRRRGAHAGGRPDRHGQVGAARHAGDAVPPLSRLAHLRLRHGALDARHHSWPGRRALRPGRRRRIAFQPLARIDREGYRTWAAEWVEGRLRHEGVAVGPDEKEAIWSALGSLAGAPVEQRTLTGLSVLLQSNVLRQALAPYVLGGAHGKLLDADSDRLGVATCSASRWKS